MVFVFVIVTHYVVDDQQEKLIYMIYVGNFIELFGGGRNDIGWCSKLDIFVVGI